MAVSSKYIVLSTLSGFFWAGIAYYLVRWAPPPFIWGGIVASPVIGLTVGLLYLNACNWRRVARIFLSLATLYIAVFLFGLAMGVCDALRPIPNRISLAVVIQSINACLWGVTVPGTFLLLWPLSFLNHSLVCHFGKLD
jgi:hypothetical protein